MTCPPFAIDKNIIALNRQKGKKNFKMEADNMDEKEADEKELCEFIELLRKFDLIQQTGIRLTAEGLKLICARGKKR